MYEFNTEFALPFDDAQAKLREALLAEQFGIVSEIDVQAVFKAKMGKEIPAYRILGACNPGLADRVLTAEHRLYPAVLKLIAGGKTRVVDERVDIDPSAVDTAARLFSAGV